MSDDLGARLSEHLRDQEEKRRAKECTAWLAHGRPLNTEVDAVIIFDDSLLIVYVQASTLGEDASESQG